MVSMARPFLADAGVREQGRPRIAPTRSTPASAATRPASITSSRARSRRASSTRSRAAKRSSKLHAGRAAASGSPWSAPGPAGLACATTAAARGHYVTLFEAAAEIGGQFNLARRIPGKEEFAETLRYFRTPLARSSACDVELNRRVDARRPARLRRRDARHRHRAAHAADSRHRPSQGRELRRDRRRTPAGRAARGDHRRRRHRLRRRRVPHRRRARRTATSATAVRRSGVVAFRDEWGIDPDYAQRGGLKHAHDARVAAPVVAAAAQGPSKVGAGLAKTTGWIRRALLKKRGVDDALRRAIRPHRRRRAAHHGRRACPQLLDVDTVVICAGQEPHRELVAGLVAAASGTS